jgi:uncharacterized alpha-E superfamily protein
VRDRISMDMWRIISSLPADDDFNADHPLHLSDVLDLLNQRVLILAGFGGIAMESMTRGHGWRFLDMGRKLERALNIVGLLQDALTPEAHMTENGALESCSTETAVPASRHEEGALLEALLEIADSSMTYRRRYLSGVQAAPVLDLLIADESNPRSLAFQLLALRDVIEHLPHNANEATRPPEERLILSLVTTVRLADVQELARVDKKGARPRLAEFLQELRRALPVLADAISHHYLSHLQPSRQLASS